MSVTLEEMLSQFATGACISYPTVNIRRTPYKQIYSGSQTVTTAGTPVPLVSGGNRIPCDMVMISADQGNTREVAIGDQNVRAASGSVKGVLVYPGNVPVVFYVDDLTRLWVDAVVSGERCCFNYFVY